LPKSPCNYDIKILNYKFEEFIKDDCFNNNFTNNFFFYIDPYGIKQLDFDFYKKIGGYKKSVELLLNLNSFGFFRDACSVFKYNNNEIESLNRIYGDNCWINIIREYSEKKLLQIKLKITFLLVILIN
jgi:hypothetical protein